MEQMMGYMSGGANPHIPQPAPGGGNSFAPMSAPAEPPMA